MPCTCEYIRFSHSLTPTHGERANFLRKRRPLSPSHDTPPAPKLSRSGEGAPARKRNVRITCDLDCTVRLQYSFLVPVLLLTYKDAFRRDLTYLKQAIE